MKKLSCIIFALFSLLFAMPGFSQVDDGYPLPFLEQWNTGTFETNNWLPEAENWSINGNEGNPDPCAEFTWDPIQTDYSISLESDQFQADYYTEGRIYLDFDIKLDDFSGDGLEQMKVQVWNWNNQVWTTVSIYSNENGDFDWASEHLDITNLAKGELFKIRFTAQGENSLHIVSWFIDNIHLYRECEGVSDLTAECDTNLNTIVLHWTTPGNGSRDLMGYNVYRSIDGGGYELVDYISEDTYLEQGELILGTLYCFMVTAVYESETDQCESAFSNEACVVCGTFITEEESQINLKIYPNPFSDVLFIESEEEIESVTVFDSRGEMLKHWNPGTMELWTGGTVEVPVRGLAPGIYLVRMDLGDVIINRKIIVKH